MPKISLDIDSLQAEKESLGSFLARPDAYSDSSYATKNKRLVELNYILEQAILRQTLEKQLEEAKELSVGGDELAEIAKMEVDEITDRLQKLEDDLFAMLAPKDPNDEKNIIVEIRAGAGGDEASLFAGELYRMYLRYCETHQLRTEQISESANDTGGIKEVIFGIKGDAPYSKLKFESGVHRVQRIPTTESQGRIHTSTVTVAVLPEAEETDIEILPSDLRIDWMGANNQDSG